MGEAGVGPAPAGPEAVLVVVITNETQKMSSQDIPSLLLQLVGQIHLLFPHAIHKQPGPLQLLLCFCNILGPEQGPGQSQPPPGDQGPGWGGVGERQGGARSQNPLPCKPYLGMPAL